MDSIAAPCLLPKVYFQSKDSNFLIIPADNPTKIPPFRIDLHSGMGSIADSTQQQKIQSKDSNPTKISPFRIDLQSGMAEWASLPKDILVLVTAHLDYFEDFFNFCLVCKSWQSASLICGKSSRTLPPRCPWVMLPDIAEMNFPEVTRKMHYQKMLAEEIEKNERIEGMDKRRFFSFSTSKIYEFELPEATRKKCLGVSKGWLMTVGYDLQINLVHPFSRQQVGLPPFMSFQDQYKYERIKPQNVVSMFVRKAVMSSNPYNSSNEDCIVLAIYGQFKLLAFARPGDKVWTDIHPRITRYLDVVYFKGKFYAIDVRGVIVVCDFHDSKRPTATPIARIPVRRFGNNSMYLVESSGALLVVVRFRKGPNYKITVIRTTYVDGAEDDVVIRTSYIDGTEDSDTEEEVDETADSDTEEDVDETEEDVDETEEDVDETEDDVDETEDDVHETEDDDVHETEDDETEDDVDDTKDDEQDLHYTVGFSIFKLEECHGDFKIDAYPYGFGDARDDLSYGREDNRDDIEADVDNKDHKQFPSSYAYPYELIPVKNLGDKSLFLGFNASASRPCSNNVRANHIYFSEDEPETYCYQPFGGGLDTGMYDVESRSITFHDASKFTSYLTPSMWYI